MARPDLEAEWSAATAAVRQKHLHVLTNKYGIPATVILDRLGVARVRVEGDAYEPDDGVEVVVVAAFEGPPRRPDGRWRAPNQIVDLVVFRPVEPGRWWSRGGIVAALGEEMIGDFDDQPVQVWRNPLAWLRSGATGVCLTTRDPIAAQDVLLRLPGIVAEDVAHGREIERLMARHWNRLPPIYVAKPALAGVA